MENTSNNPANGYSLAHFPDSCHICLIYDNEEQRKKIVSEYLAEGIRKGEIVSYFTDKTNYETVLSWLSDQGINLPESDETPSFKIADADKAYCPNGSFEPEKMIERSKKRYKVAKEAGFCGSRASGEMSWALKGIPGSERIFEYESLLNAFKEDFPHSGMCQYDSRLFDGATLLKILQVHPYVIAHGQVVQNPYYIKPSDFKSILLSK
jgi:hypothetical protein